MANPEKNSSKSILIGTIVVAILLIALVVPFAIKGDQPTGRLADADTAEERIQPVARIEIQKSAPAAAAQPGKPRDGATIFNTICSACHNTGAAGAPKTGDKAAWAPRIAQGKDVLYKSVMSGKNAMPPRGGAADLTDDEVKSAVDHIVGLAK